MLPTLLALTAALFLITSSNALSIDPSVHFARHHQIISRRPEVKRDSTSARCQKRGNSTSVSAAVPSSTPTSSTPPAPSSSQAPPPSSSPSAGTGKVGIAWAYNNDPSLKNFITDKVSAFVDFSIFFSSFPYFISLAYTLGTLKNHQILMDCNILQCYGAPAKSVHSRPLSSQVMQMLF